MNKLLLSLALSLGALSVTPAMAAAPAFSASQMAQVRIKDLSFNEVMRQFYNGQMVPTVADDTYIDSLPNIGLGRADSTAYRTVALMRPIELYDNTEGEQRYLVTIEKVLVHDDSLEYCFPCGSKADLYSFKKLNNGQFQLVSRTSESVEFSSIYSSMDLQNNDLYDTLQALGENLVGSIFMSGYMRQGYTTESWAVLHLPENDFINTYALGDAGSDNNGAYDSESSLNYDYEGIVEVMPEKSTYYPIKLTYKGIAPDDPERSDFINKSFVMKFNPVKKVYETTSSFAAL
ncbi:hypothetical protein I3252_03770 [Psychrobacter sp. Ps4]|uniref:hypothetical protein n=1 Tax=Psychrobacter sp. Ps4 TaxID=2790958 RepID=UPI001EDCF99B|nr:hypothetical protein [Psychrobacter sp. Ps4]MCG3808601.1 hypothetical protein [Psychrobacter sp. Ps4]